MGKSRCILVILVVALLPATASGNAGTPLIWASMLHLVFGNAIIGLIEGLLLAAAFKTSKVKSILVLIAANYASAWAGGLFVSGPLASLPDITIETLRSWFLAFVVVAFVVTLVIEFPFFWFVLRSREHPFQRALVAAPAVHGVSYALLLVWYWMASGTSMMTAMKVVPPDAMAPMDSYVLYYLSRDGGEVMRMDSAARGSARPVAAVAAGHPNDRLFARPREDAGFDLFVYLDPEDRGEVTEALVIGDFSDFAPLDPAIAADASRDADGSWFNFGPVPRFAAESDWKFRTGFWPVEGFSGENKKTGKKVAFSLETPFAQWPVRNATHLAGDFLIAQLGDDQICLIHPESGRIALLARGKGPVVAKPR